MDHRQSCVRLVSESARVDDPVRVTVAGVEIEGIEGIESSTMRVRVDRRLFSRDASSFVRVVD